MSDKVERILGELAAGSTETYEAQQQIKLLAQRMIAQKKLSEARGFLAKAVGILVSKNSTPGAFELSQLILKTLSTPASSEEVDVLIRVFNDLDEDSTSDLGFRFAQEALKLTRDTRINIHGNTRLHLEVGTAYHNRGKFPQAMRHFVLGGHTGSAADAVAEWAATGAPEEFDLFVARAALQFLCISDTPSNATDFLQNVKPHCPAAGSPLFHFVEFLAAAAKFETPSPEFFKTLRAKYAPAISRDPTFSNYVDRIGERFFHVKQDKPQDLMSMISSWLSGGDDEGDQE